jgi:hypothetical protein
MNAKFEAKYIERVANHIGLVIVDSVGAELRPADAFDELSKRHGLRICE